MSKEIVLAKQNVSLTFGETDVTPLFKRCLASVRDEMRDNPYVIEALKVLPAGGYRSAIGSFWNAVVDDLRNKIIHRSLSLFNKSVACGKEIKTYEDFQNSVNDDQLIEGAYKIGVIGFEASKILRHAKETRHYFDGHPKSSEPSILKVLAMMDVVAYKHTCALTGYRMTTLDMGGMESIVDAAHIHAFSDSRNNDPRNGLALSKNAHWQFDRGLPRRQPAPLI